MTKLDLTTNGFIIADTKVLLIYHKKYQMWIGVGGHLDPNETPDSQLIKEVKEEVGIDVDILSTAPNIPISNNTISVCPLPFHADIHNVGDHNHYAQYYVCVPKDKVFNIVPEEAEIKEYHWFTQDEVNQNPEIEQKTKAIVNEAFKTYYALTR